MIRVNTVTLLKAVHEALQEYQRTGDIELLAAAESVLSALVVVIRYEEASVPDTLGPYLIKVIRRGK